MPKLLNCFIAAAIFIHRCEMFRFYKSFNLKTARNVNTAYTFIFVYSTPKILHRHKSNC